MQQQLGTVGRHSGDVDQSDVELAVAVRAGDDSAAEFLLDRHAAAVAALGPSPAFDSVAASGRAALEALRSGDDQDLPFRAVWLSLHQRGTLPGHPVAHSVVWGAFGTLPAAWRLAVWHREVEGQRPAEIARHLDMPEQQVTRALASSYAALRRRVALAHPPTSTAAECQELSDAYRFSPPVSLSAAEVRSLREHGRHCDHCLGLIRELFVVEHSLRLALASVVLGEAAERYLATRPRVARLRLAGATVERPQRKVHPLLGTLSAAGVGAAAMALVLSTPAVSPVRDNVPQALQANVPAPGTTLWPTEPRTAAGVRALSPLTYSTTAIDAAYVGETTQVAGAHGGPGRDGQQGGSTDAPTPTPDGPLVPETPGPDVEPAPEPTEGVTVAVEVTAEQVAVVVASEPGPAPIEVEVPVPGLGDDASDATDAVEPVLDTTGGLVP